MWRVGAVCAASGLALPLVLSAQEQARCQQQQAPHNNSAAAAATAASERELAAFADWLRRQGADVDAITFKQSDKDQGRYGVYAGEGVQQRGRRGWLGSLAGLGGWGSGTPVPVAAFPLSGTLTAATLAQHPQQGPVMRELLQLGLLEERTAVILHLAVERQRLRQQRAAGGGGGGEGGGMLPWLALLPDSFSTTLYFSELDLQWLRGTTLHKATRLRQKALQEAWKRLAPAAAQLAAQSGVAQAPSFEDFAWANSVFWSRAIAFPGPAADGRGVEMQEGIVPGLDFCNHASPSPCYWTVAAAAALKQPKQPGPGKGGAGASPNAVSLVCPRRALPQPGQEVSIDYGGKSNEELMFLYGFALRDNPAEVLTLMCPLPPPAEWDEGLRARLALLTARGLRPQLHLPSADLLAPSDGAATKRGKAAKAAPAAGGAAGGGTSDADLPEGVLRTLEVFVLSPAEVAAELEAAASDGGAPGSGGGSGGAPGGGGRGSGVSEEDASGQRMAVLTTLVRLLEVKVLEQEGQEGTGPLEGDELLARAGDALFSRNQRHALLYRMGQKALARAYLAHAKRLLQREMAHLARLQSEA